MTPPATSDPALQGRPAGEPAPALADTSGPGTGRFPLAAPLVDSHCHIVFRNFDADLDAVAQRWREAGVRALLHACVEPGEIAGIRALADRFPELSYSVGVHPLDTRHWQPGTVDALQEAARADRRVVAIGELGLDLYREKNLEQQLEVLIPQLDLAVALDLPVIIHCRDAAAPMLALLEERQRHGAVPRGVMHCWGGTPEEMEGFLAHGLFISFSGTVTFPRAENTHACARLVPSDRFLVETDCPFLAPAPRRGQRNEPALVAAVAARVAELRGVSLEEVANTSTANAVRLFGLALHNV